MKHARLVLRRRLAAFLIVLAVALLALVGSRFPASPPVAQAVSASVVISQVYGGGGNAGATLKNDFIELFNRGTSAQSLNGWSVQYASSTGTSWTVTNLTNVTLQPGQYYLVQEAAGAGGTTNLPTPDATGGTNMSATAGKVALVNSTTAIASGTACPTGASIIDFIGFGTGTNCSETAVAPAPSNTAADLRALAGCTDTDNNSTDFATGTPNPRNTSTAFNPCSGGGGGTPTLSINDVSQAEGNAGTTNFNFTVSLSAASASNVTFNWGTADGTATAPSDYTAVTGGSGTITAGNTSTTVTVSVNGDTTVEGSETFFVNLTNPTNATIADGQGQGTITNDDIPPAANVVISQVYGGGGNSGSTYTNDYIELYNRSSSPVDLTGWSVQYSSVNQTTWTATPLTGTIQPGHYYLVQEGAGAGGTTPLPTSDATGTLALGATNGKVALINDTNAASGNCPASYVDLVGYGTAECSETSPTAALSNLTAALRKSDGCVDTNNNSQDFNVTGPAPRNSSSPANTCGGDPSQLAAYGSANPTSLDPSSSTLLTVTVTPATTPPSTGVTVTADLTSIGGAASQQFYDDGTHGDATPGDNVFSYLAVIPANETTGAKNIAATATDAQQRTASAGITVTVSSPTCGVERWSVKTGTDPDASKVDTSTSTPTTIAEMRSWPAPQTPPDNARVVPYETTVWQITGTLTVYKKETDVDYHIVVQDSAGNTVITEIPCPCCANGSPWQSMIDSARRKFDARLTATASFQTANLPVRIKGVGFFDFIHGQTGVAPNGIELHPILDIDFLDSLPGSILISEFRTGGATTKDEFIELYNSTDIALGLAGYKLSTSAGDIALSGTIPAHGHFLVANSDGYTLGGYPGGTPDLNYSGVDVAADSPISLKNASNVVIDKVGFTTSAPGSCEGTCLTSTSATGQYSFVRKLTSGLPQDSDDNSSDFVLVATDPTAVSGASLGAPGPEGTTSPLNTGSQIKSTPFGSCMGTSSSPNRTRTAGPYNDTLTPSSPNGGDPATNPYTPGTMTIRRTFTNKTGATVNTLRFRVVDMTAGPASAGTADLRLLSSNDEAVVVNPCPGSPTSSRGLTLEQPPTQSWGGGLNSTAASGYVAVNHLAPGDSVDLNFLLGVAQPGSFRFFVIVEALPGPTPPAASPAAWQTAPTNFEGEKGEGVRHGKGVEWGKHPTLFEEEDEN